MKLHLGEVNNGFKVLESAFIEEVNADGYIMEHIQSGARLFYLDSTDDNKVFSIGFRTPPFDDSGVAHILEHSTLCGSRKYPLKEPFVELVKGSLNTFLNAMTYSDKTVYPVASRNDKDFVNLMDVYLDAVFYPLIYKNPYTLQQEGWHYELEDAEHPLQYNGVVYNEMKGVYSSPDAYMERAIMQGLFPDTAYRFESGGFPSSIPELTEEKFLDFHRTYYCGENSFIYLYGNMDISSTLGHLDGYLRKFVKTREITSVISLQAPLTKTKEITTYYPVGSDKNCENMTYHELAIVTAETTDFKTCTALKLLESILLEVEAGPLRRALLEAGIGQTVNGSFVTSMRQSVFSIRVSGSKENQRDKFVSVVYGTLEKLMKNGIDRSLLEAALNAAEFKLRENDFGSYPKGLVFGLEVYDSWIYGADPIDSLRFKQRIHELRDALKGDYYEKLIETYLLDNTHKVLVTLLPDPDKEEKDRLENEKKLAEVKKKFSSSEIAAIVRDCADLHRRQGIEDSVEAVKTIPVLRRSDIRRDIDRIEMCIERKGQSEIVYLPLFTNGIAYFDWELDISGIEPEKLPYLALYCDIFGKLDTKRFTYKELATKIIMYTGGIGVSTDALSNYKNPDKYSVQFSLKAKVLTENLDKLQDIMSAIAFETKFDDVKRFKELVDEIDTCWDNTIFSRGMEIALSRLYGYLDDASRVNSAFVYDYYKFVKELHSAFDKRAEETLLILADIAKKCFNKTKYHFVYSCDEKDRQRVLSMGESFAAKFNESEISGINPVKIPVSLVNEAFATSGKVQYVVAGGNFRHHGFKFSGAMRVLMTILSYEYLWTKVRIQGGAYGASGKFMPDGILAFSSYRDPQLSKTLDVYRNLAQWLRNKTFLPTELDKYVIGTISGMDTPLTNSMKVAKAVKMRLKEVTEDDQQQQRDEVLDVSALDLKKLADLIETTLQDGYLCVFGGEQAIAENKNLFSTIIKL